MISLNSSTPDAIHAFRASPWPHQKTLVTPRSRMAAFLAALLGVFPIEQGVASTDQVVFEPDNVLELLANRKLRLEDDWRFCASASGAEDVQALLTAMLSDWIDFVFVPSPATFAIYADHDEYLTVYVPSESGLNQFIAHIEAQGFRFAGEYVRPSEGPLWR